MARRKDKPLEHPPRRFPSFLSAAVRAEMVSIASEVSPQSWQPGRQGTGYEKLDLRASEPALERRATFLDRFLAHARVSLGVKFSDWDAYLLRYRNGAHVPAHRDPAGDRPHLRLNALVAAADAGSGELRLAGQVFELVVGDAVLFRPDIIEHRVSPVVGERLVFSLGCIVAEDAG